MLKQSPYQSHAIPRQWACDQTQPISCFSGFFKLEPVGESSSDVGTNQEVNDALMITVPAL